MTNFYLGIGSNKDRQHNISSCLRILRNSFRDIDISSVYQSPAFGFVGADFYNFVVRVGSHFTPREMKLWLQKIEDQHGRDRNQPRYSDRTLDIDLLLVDDCIINDGIIEVPRCEIFKRDYVLRPLCDLAPELVHPVVKKRLTDLWQAFEGERSARLVTTFQLHL